MPLWTMSDEKAAFESKRAMDKIEKSVDVSFDSKQLWIDSIVSRSVSFSACTAAMLCCNLFE